MTKKALTLVLGLMLAATFVLVRPAEACLPGSNCNVTEVVIRAINWEPPDYGDLFHFEGKAQGATVTGDGPQALLDGWFDGFVTMQAVDLPNLPSLPPLPIDQTHPGEVQLAVAVATGTGSLTVNTGTGTFSGQLTVVLAADGAGVWVVTQGARAIGSGVVTADQFTGSMSSALVSL